MATQQRPGIRTAGPQHSTALIAKRQHTHRRRERLQPTMPGRQGFSDLREQRLAQGLGWFSIGLGLAELLAPHKLGRMIGIGKQAPLLRTLGLREIASGVGILTREEPRPWLWSRVGGDVMDLALLGAALRAERADKSRVTAATIAVLGVTFLDLFTAQQVSRHPRARLTDAQQDGSILVEKTMTVNRSAEDAYRYWRDLQNLPRFMMHLKSVRMTGDRRSHWVAKAPAGMQVEWDAELTDDKPNELIAWRSLPGAGVENSGSVRFARATGGRGSVVRVHLQYRPPGGVMTPVFAKLFGEEPAQQVREDLRRFKAMLETGEVPTTEGQPTGRRSAIGRLFAKVRL